MAKPLTPRQYEIVAWMVAYFRENYRMPVMEDLTRAFGWSSRHAALDHMARIAEKGYLTHLGRKGASAPWCFSEKCKVEFGIDTITSSAMFPEAVRVRQKLNVLHEAIRQACDHCKALQSATPCDRCIWRHVVRQVEGS